MTGKTNAQRKILLTTPDTVTPTKSQQIITTPDGYDGMDQITINAIPSNYIDTSDATATASNILSGKTAYVDGSLITGTIATKTSSNLTASGKTVTVPAGYYASTATKSVSTATQATPTISVSSSGVITASSTQSAGYVNSGTKSATYTLSSSDDSDFKASNIKNGVTIFGITGTLSSKNLLQQTYSCTLTGTNFYFPFNSGTPIIMIVIPLDYGGAMGEISSCYYDGITVYSQAAQFAGYWSNGSFSYSGSQITLTAGYGNFIAGQRYHVIIVYN